MDTTFINNVVKLDNELFKTLTDTVFFLNNTSFDKIVPMKIIKGIVSKNSIIKNKNGEIPSKTDFDFKIIDTIKT